MSGQLLVHELRESGVHVALVDGELRYLAERGRFTPALRERTTAGRERIVWELSLTSSSAVTRSTKWQGRWLVDLECSLRSVAEESDADPQFLEERIASWIEAAEERAAIQEFDGGLERAQAEARAVAAVVAAFESELGCDERPARFLEVCDLRRERGPYDTPMRGCYACGTREFVRVRGGPMWICVRCHPPQFEADVVARMTAQEPSLREARRGR